MTFSLGKGYLLRNTVLVTYKSISSAFSGLSVRDDDRFLDVPEHGEVLSERFVSGMIRQSSDKQFSPCGVFLLGGSRGGQIGQTPDQTIGGTQHTVGRTQRSRHQHNVSLYTLFELKRRRR